MPGVLILRAFYSLLLTFLLVGVASMASGEGIDGWASSGPSTATARDASGVFAYVSRTAAAERERIHVAPDSKSVWVCLSFRALRRAPRAIAKGCWEASKNPLPQAASRSLLSHKKAHTTLY